MVPEIFLEVKWGATVEVWGLCPLWGLGTKPMARGLGTKSL